MRINVLIIVSLAVNLMLAALLYHQRSGAAAKSGESATENSTAASGAENATAENTAGRQTENSTVTVAGKFS